MVKNYYLFFLFIYILFISYSNPAIYPPSLKWKMLESKHFKILYHQGEKKAVLELLYFAEKAYNEIALFWNKEELPDNIYILLIDAVDFSNGIASIIPYNSIIIYLRPPSGEGFLGNNENWLKTVITHELMHIIHLNQSGGAYKLFRYILGRNPLLFPNLFQPAWSIEGLATFAETKWTSKGRGRAADVNMIFKIAALFNKLPSPDQATGPLVKWPWHNASYFFGYSFFQYLSNNYPENYIYEVNKQYSRSIIPFNISNAYKKIYNKSFNDLWKEWQSNLIEKYKNYSLQQEYNASFKRGYYIFQPIFSEDNSKIYYSILDPHTFPKICELRINELKEECFLDRYYGNSLAMDKGILYFSQIERHHNYYIYSDIYAYDLKTKRNKRLTYGLRAKDPVPVQDEIFFVKNGIYSSGIFSIKKRDLPCKASKCKIKEILKEEEGIEYSSPKWNGMQELFAAAKWEKGGIMSIIVFNKEGKIIDWIGKDSYRYLSPVWTKDGKNILFSSDISGVFNIYSYSLRSKKICQITDEVGGAFYPAISEDKLAYVKYGMNGFELAFKNLNDERKNCKTLEQSPQKNATLTNINFVNYKEKNYSPLPLLLPRFWMPLFSKEQEDYKIGIFTYSQDLLYHFYYLFFYYEYFSKEFSYDFNYTYDRFYPTIGLKFNKEIDWYNEANYFIEKKSVFFILFPFYKIKYKIYGNFGLERAELISRIRGEYSNLKLNWFFWEIDYNSAKKYDYSISNTDGRKVRLLFKEVLNKNDIKGSLYRIKAEWNEYIPFFLRHNVIALRFSYGKSWGSSKYRIGFPIGSFSTDTDNFLLRGYKENFLIAPEAYGANVEYRFPLVNIERGKDNLPLFLQRLHFNFFFDIVRAYDFDKGWIIKRGAGFETSLDLSIIYQFKITTTLGFAIGLDKEGTNKIYFRIGPSF